MQSTLETCTLKRVNGIRVSIRGNTDLVSPLHSYSLLEKKLLSNKKRVIEEMNLFLKLK